MRPLFPSSSSSYLPDDGATFVVGGWTRRVRSYALGRLRLQGQRQAWGPSLVPASRRRRSSQSVQTRRFKRCASLERHLLSGVIVCFTSHRIVYLSSSRTCASLVTVCLWRNARARETLKRSARRGVRPREERNLRSNPRDDHRLDRKG